MRPVVFLSDYGLEDEFVGICHGVIARVAPEARVIDLTHSIPPQDVLRGALALAQAVAYMPAPAVYLAVVDPEVGGGRRAVALQTEAGSFLVGPDNGLLAPAVEALGGVVRAVEISSPDVLLHPVSQTFHGRDVFAPAAATLARGEELSTCGPDLDPGSLVSLEVPLPSVEPGRVVSQVLAVDRFGNLQLDARPDALEAAALSEDAHLVLTASGATERISRGATFADLAPGQYGLIADSFGWLAVVLNRGSAAEALGVGAGDAVEITRSAERRVGR